MHQLSDKATAEQLYKTKKKDNINLMGIKKANKCNYSSEMPTLTLSILFIKQYIPIHWKLKLSFLQ